MFDESSLLPEVYAVDNGYISSPISIELLSRLVRYDDCVEVREDYRWIEYVINNSYIYPQFLTELAKAGIAFTWEFQHTEDFSYYAYNFPTEENPVNLTYFKTGDKRKGFPRMSKKKLNLIESTSAANELLYQLGIKNGSN